MGISGIESMSVVTANQNLAVFAGIRRGQKLRFDPTSLGFSIDGNALMRTFRNSNMGVVNSSVTNDATFSTPIVYSFSKVVMAGNLNQATLDNAIRGLEVLEQTYRNERRATEKHAKMVEVLKQVRAIASGGSQLLLNQFQKLGQVTEAETQVMTADQNSFYLKQIFEDNQILNLAAKTQGENNDYLLSAVSTKLKMLDPSLRDKSGMDFLTWYNSLPPANLYKRKFQEPEGTFEDDFWNMLSLAERGLSKTSFVHYYPLSPTTSNEMTWRVYLCPTPVGIGRVIAAINGYLMKSMAGRHDTSLLDINKKYVYVPEKRNSVRVRSSTDHGIYSFKHLFDTKMRFYAKDRMVLYMAGKEKAVEIGEAIYASCAGVLITDATAATINTTQVKPGVYIATEPGYVSTGMDFHETQSNLLNDSNQQQQTVTLLSSNLISMALVNWCHDYQARIAMAARPRDRQYNTLENLFNDPNARNQEYQLFLKFLAVAMNAYEKQREGFDMRNGRRRV